MITIFTGAGASRALGYPTTAEFFESGNTKSLKEDEIYRHLQKKLKKDILDVEDVLRLLDPFAIIQNTPTGDFILPPLGNHWIRRIPDYVNNINNMCFDHYGKNPSTKEVSEAYLPLLKLCQWKQTNVSLYTTNYDPVTDKLRQIADSNNIECEDGFDRHGVWDTNTYSYTKNYGLSIYRLHGSMSWVEQDGTITNSRDYSRRVTGYSKHLIIYPGFKGNPEKDGHQTFRFSHSALRTELKQSDFLFVIGFSFRDPHINAIFEESLQNNPRLNLIVWNPNWPLGPDAGLEKLNQQNQGRIFHYEKNFGTSEDAKDLPNFINEILNHINYRSKE